MHSNRVSEEIVIVSWWGFAAWWSIFLAVHIVTCGYNALYAFFYSELEETTLQWYLEFYHIGMTPDCYKAIAGVHAMMSLLHGLCVLLMVGSSVWFRTLAFTPWRESSILRENGKSVSAVAPHLFETNFTARVNKTKRNHAFKLTSLITNRYGLLGINGKHFYLLLTCREITETAFQTVQAYRMSFLLPNMLLNRFYVAGLFLNCWSSAIIHVLPFRGSDARKRFASLACDCALDLLSCMGVTVIVVLSYVGQYNTDTTDFQVGTWYNDEWVARALNEFQIVVVVSWSDLLSRSIISLGLLMTTTNLKELLFRSPTRGNRVTTANDPIRLLPKQVNVKPVADDSSIHNIPVKEIRVGRISSAVVKKWVRGWEHAVMHGIHLLFFMWGLLVLGLHIQSSVHPTLPQCTLQVRPWAVSRPSCFLLCLDCDRLSIAGHIDEVDAKWHEFDGSTVVIMLIKHCPSLDVPDIFNEFHQLISIKIYNSTIVEWRESAAITNANHPAFLALMLARVNMTDGLLPAGFQSSDSPVSLYDWELCVTNLREVPDDLDSKWHLGSMVLIEYSQLQSVPSVLLRIAPSYLSLAGSPIVELPPEIFEVEGMTDLSLGFTAIRELPQNVTHLSSTLITIYIPGTDVGYFFPWMNGLLGRENSRWTPRPIMAGGSVYCEDLTKIKNGSATSFSATVSPDTFVELMDPTNTGPDGLISSLVDCSPPINGLTGPLFPLAAEDIRNGLTF